MPAPTVYDKRKGHRLARASPGQTIKSSAGNSPHGELTCVADELAAPLRWATTGHGLCPAGDGLPVRLLPKSVQRLSHFTPGLDPSAHAHVCCATNSLFSRSTAPTREARTSSNTRRLVWSHGQATEQAARPGHGVPRAPVRDRHGRALQTGASAAALRHRCRYEGTLRMACPGGTQ